ncbi:germin-like protein subfamily 2 member 4 [Juglans microcarpa x Juglans regia]|uniref:germin-like protein subfamily 2 member 4 n=1 Tax=Juglans microcarpa x Juglans regia TaxID=2249226 RepID=UPI001B7E1C17|nr:germin-like protein subfamily 2 member 4 [Juglans microcarpa x Juglans regia]
MLVKYVLACLIIFTAIPSTIGSDPDSLQDICVAVVPSSDIKVNGFVCKDDANVTADDFFFGGLVKPNVINTSIGTFNATLASVREIPGLNTLALSVARSDYLPGGPSFTPHLHPRAAELIYVLEGQMNVGFITTANKLISKTVKKGEVFVFPKALVHYHYNDAADEHASMISVFDSQGPGNQVIATSLFAATPPLPEDVLSLAFQVDIKQIEKIKENLKLANLTVTF